MSAAATVDWLAARGIAVESVVALPGDLSPRRYLRARRASGESLLVALYPAAMADAQRRFERAAALLASAGVRVPAILVNDLGEGRMAIEDLGERTVFELSGGGWSLLEPYFRDAVEQLRRIAGLDRTAVSALDSPPLDAELLDRELDPTFAHLFDPAGLAAWPVERERWRGALRQLCGRLAADPPVPCHRDFMARNLVALPGGQVGVIDFQDLRLGPPAYDLASLLNDSLFPGRGLEATLLAEGLAAGLAPEQYARAVVQRCLKAAGTFARFAAQGRAERLELVPATLARARPFLARLPETAAAFAGVRKWWDERWPPEAALLD